MHFVVPFCCTIVSLRVSLVPCATRGDKGRELFAAVTVIQTHSYMCSSHPSPFICSFLCEIIDALEALRGELGLGTTLHCSFPKTATGCPLVSSQQPTSGKTSSSVRYEGSSRVSNGFSARLLNEGRSSHDCLLQADVSSLNVCCKNCSADNAVCCRKNPKRGPAAGVLDVFGSPWCIYARKKCHKPRFLSLA